MILWLMLVNIRKTSRLFLKAMQVLLEEMQPIQGIMQTKIKTRIETRTKIRTKTKTMINKSADISLCANKNVRQPTDITIQLTHI